MTCCSIPLTPWAPNSSASRSFYATIVVLADGEERKIDARPSDAIALAVRSNAPMFVEDDIMNRLGTVSTHAEEVDDEQEFEKFDEFVHTLSPDDF